MGNRSIFPPSLLGAVLGVIISFSGFLFCSGCGDAPAARQEVTNKMVEVSYNTSYEVLEPPEISPDRRYPLFFFLAPGGDPKIFLQSLRGICKKKEIIWAGTYNFKTDMPHTTYISCILASLKDLQEKYPIDSGRMFICGFSEGVQGAFNMCFLNPGVFSGIISNCGTMHPSLLDPAELEKLRVKKVAILSGKLDPIVRPEILNREESVMKSARIQTNFISFQGGHEVANEQNFETAVEWLLK